MRNLSLKKKNMFIDENQMRISQTNRFRMDQNTERGDNYISKVRFFDNSKAKQITYNCLNKYFLENRKLNSQFYKLDNYSKWKKRVH